MRTLVLTAALLMSAWPAHAERLRTREDLCAKADGYLLKNTDFWPTDASCTDLQHEATKGATDGFEFKFIAPQSCGGDFIIVRPIVPGYPGDGQLWIVHRTAVTFYQ